MGCIGQLKDVFSKISLIHFSESMSGLGEQVKGLWGIFWPWLVGSLVSSTVLAVLAYPVAKRSVVRHRHKSELRRAERHRRLHESRGEFSGEGPAASL